MNRRVRPDHFASAMAVLIAASALAACGSGTPSPAALGKSPSTLQKAPTTTRRTTTTAPTTLPPSASTTSLPTTTTTTTTPTSPLAGGSHGPITSPPLPAPGAGFLADHVTAVGDSVMIDYEDPLEQDIPGITVEAAVSRQWSDGEAILQQLKASGQLGAVVIVGLSTNGPITSGDFDAMMSILSGASRVVFVTVHVDQPWQDQNNSVLESGAASHPNTVVADWATLADQNPGWLYSDGTHLPIDGTGAQALASLVASKA